MCKLITCLFWTQKSFPRRIGLDSSHFMTKIRVSTIIYWYSCCSRNGSGVAAPLLAPLVLLVYILTFIDMYDKLRCSGRVNCSYSTNVFVLLLVYILTFIDVHNELTFIFSSDVHWCNMQRIDILPLNKHGSFLIFYNTDACFYMSVPPADPKLSVLLRM